MAKGIVTAISARFLQVIIKLLAIIIISRNISVENFGEFTFAISFAYILALFSDFGASTSMSRRLASTSEKNLKNELLVALKQIALFGTLVCGASLFLADKLSEFFNIKSLVSQAYLIIILALAVIIEDLGSKFYQGIKTFDIYAKVHIISGWMPWLFTLLASFISQSSFMVLLGYIVGYIPFLIIISTKIAITIKNTPQPTFDLEPTTFIQSIKTSLPLFMSGLSMQIFLRSDILLVQYFTNSESVGIYGIAARIADTSQVLAIAISNAIASHFVDFQKEYRTFRKKLSQWTLNVSIPYILLAFALATSAHVVIPLLFGEKYTPVVQLIYLFIPFIFARALSTLYSPVFDYLGYIKTRAKIVGFVAAANIFLNILLIPRLGYLGAILSTLIVYLPMVGYYIFKLHSLGKFSRKRIIQAYLPVSKVLLMSTLLTVPLVLCSTGYFLVLLVYSSLLIVLIIAIKAHFIQFGK
ncbi:oligosaccharide flippase family protein [bacterium]|nr:oligosaccharide flippase family protein [bacterium]